MTRGLALRRLLQVAPTVAGIVVLGWLLMELAPGDPLLAIAGESGDEAYYAMMRERYALDDPLHLRFLTFAGNVLAGDLGDSYLHGRPAMEVILERLPATALLAAASLAISTPLGLGLGLFAASRRRGLGEVLTTTATLGLYAAPVFWVGQLALLLFAYRLGWFPVQGLRSAGGPTGLAGVLDLLRHLALPALVLASQELAVVARLTRLSVRENLDADHVLVARGKGVPERLVRRRHALRPALLPIATVLGTRVGQLLSGAVIVEVVFSWPGIGRLLLTAMQTRNAPIVLGVFLLVAASVVLANLLTDLSYTRLDPRVRLR